jgi:hypothetical protein
MENKSITTVEWLEQEFLFSKEDNGKIEIGQQLFDILITKAKQMEKEQIENAFQYGKWNGHESTRGITKYKDPAEYYNETYNK